MPPVVLFDVDGTLIDSGGAGARSWTHAFDKLYGISADIGSHTAAGETDPVVARKTFEAAVGREPSEAELARLFAVYLLRLSEEVRTSEGYRVLEGVEDLLLMLSDAGTMLGLVSGAMEGAARVKLSRADLNRFFVFGGYGSDSDDRAMLTRGAIDKAAMLHGTTSRRIGCSLWATRRSTWKPHGPWVPSRWPWPAGGSRWRNCVPQAPDTCSPRWPPGSQRRASEGEGGHP
jgi:phosphoglycolate phosphatase